MAERKILMSKALLHNMLDLPDDVEVVYVNMEGFMGHRPETPIQIWVRGESISEETKRVNPIYHSKLIDGETWHRLDHIEYL
jgi:hypothetical protein